MQTRMEKYEKVNQPVVKSRVQKNQGLYENLRNNVIADFDVNSNVSVINQSSDNIDVTKLKQLLDQKYNGESRRKSIEIPTYPEPEVEETFVDTKEYDINAILEKAKKGKNVDYNRERLKKIREAQFEILNNLDLELKKIEEPKRSVAISEEESQNLAELVNTITSLELKNRADVAAGETDDLFASLMETKAIKPVKYPINDLDDDDEEENKDGYLHEETKKVDTIAIEPVQEGKISSSVTEENDDEEEKTEDQVEELDKTKELSKQIEKKEEISEGRLEETLSKIDVKTNDFEEFKDINSGNSLSMILRIIAFLIVIALIIGAIYILDNMLGLGLF